MAGFYLDQQTLVPGPRLYPLPFSGPSPDIFTGQQSEFFTFKIQCQIYFAAMAQLIPGQLTHSYMVFTAGLCLRERAGDWFNTYAAVYLGDPTPVTVNDPVWLRMFESIELFFSQLQLEVDKWESLARSYQQDPGCSFEQASIPRTQSAPPLFTDHITLDPLFTTGVQCSNDQQRQTWIEGLDTSFPCPNNNQEPPPAYWDSVPEHNLNAFDPLYCHAAPLMQFNHVTPIDLPISREDEEILPLIPGSEDLIMGFDEADRYPVSFSPNLLPMDWNNGLNLDEVNWQNELNALDDVFLNNGMSQQL